MLRSSARRTGLAVVALAAAVACTATPTSPSHTRRDAFAAAAPPAAPLSIDVPAALGALRFVAFGDSITYGVLSSFDGMALFDGSSFSYPVRLEIGLHANHRPQQFVVFNRGVPAEAAITGGTRRIASVLTSDRPHALLLLEGINDLEDGSSVSQVGAALQTIVNTSVQRGVPVFLATMFQTYAVDRPDGTFRTNGADLVPSLNQRIRQIATQQNVYLVDLYWTFGTDRSLIGGDGLHPTEEGYDLMAGAFLTAIEHAYPVRGSFQ